MSGCQPGNWCRAPHIAMVISVLIHLSVSMEECGFVCVLVFGKGGTAFVSTCSQTLLGVFPLSLM